MGHKSVARLEIQLWNVDRLAQCKKQVSIGCPSTVHDSMRYLSYFFHAFYEYCGNSTLSFTRCITQKCIMEILMVICIWFGIMVTTATMTSLKSSRLSHGCMCWWKFGKVAHVVTIIHLKQQPAEVHLASTDLFNSLMFGEAPIGCCN